MCDSPSCRTHTGATALVCGFLFFTLATRVFAEPQPYYLPQDEAESGSLLALDESPKEEECYQDLEIPGIVTPPYNENNPTLPYPSTPTVGEGTEGFPAGENYEACMAAMAKARPDLLRECEISWGPNSRNADTEKLEFCKSEVNKTMGRGRKAVPQEFLICRSVYYF